MSQYPPPPGPDQHHLYNPVYTSLADARPNGDQYVATSGGPALAKPETMAMSSSGQLYSLARELQRSVEDVDESRGTAHPNVSTIPQAQQHTPQQASGTSHSQSQTPVATPDSAARARLRKACDSCSIRKVKCDESGPPCRACAALEIPCTFSRPTKRRGPPNRHAAALKRQKLELEAGLPYSGPASPASPTNAAQALAALSSQTSQSQLSAESICPLETLDLLINDFFTYIHPLCPFPHEPSFREAWKRREDLTNKSFLALLASMIGALVASFPRKPRLHLKAQQKEKLFPNHMSMVHHCQQVCSLARGPAYLENEHISVYDAATSYFLALTGTYTVRWRQGRLYFGECLTIIRVLNLHRASGKDIADQPLGAMPGHFTEDVKVKDNITLQIGRRIFWTMFVGVKTLQQLGATFDELQIPPPTPTDPYPPLPVEVDDFCIYPDRIEPQPAGLLAEIAGFNANVRAFSSYNSLSTMEMAWGIDHIVDWERQKRVLHESLKQCKDATTLLPPELKVNLHHQSDAVPANGTANHFYSSAPSINSARSLLSLAGVHDERDSHEAPEERRHMQYEIQKANIYASSLSTRSYIVQKYWNLVEAHARLRTQNTPASRPASPHSPSVGIVAAGIDGMLSQRPAPTSNFDVTDQEFRDERESIVKDLLVVLGSIDQVNMEPNGESFTMKIRSIASTLLDAPDSGKGEMEVQAKEYLAAFLDILVKLEKSGPTSSPRDPEDEAAELKDWANLREYQIKFAQAGGFNAT